MFSISVAGKNEESEHRQETYFTKFNPALKAFSAQAS